MFVLVVDSESTGLVVTNRTCDGAELPYWFDDTTYTLYDVFGLRLVNVNLVFDTFNLVEYLSSNGCGGMVWLGGIGE